MSIREVVNIDIYVAMGRWIDTKPVSFVNKPVPCQLESVNMNLYTTYIEALYVM